MDVLRARRKSRGCRRSLDLNVSKWEFTSSLVYFHSKVDILDTPYYIRHNILLSKFTENWCCCSYRHGQIDLY